MSKHFKGVAIVEEKQITRPRISIDGEEWEQKINPNKIAHPKFSEFMDKFDYTSPYNNRQRCIKPSVNIVEEYKLVVAKQSKLSKWERNEVVRLFKQNFKKV